MSYGKEALKGFVELIERRYGVSVVDYHYVLVDERFQKYNMMLDVQFPEAMKKQFAQLYAGKDHAMHVAWEACPITDSVRFYAEIGNNILLLWDTLCKEGE